MRSHNLHAHIVLLVCAYHDDTAQARNVLIVLQASRKKTEMDAAAKKAQDVARQAAALEVTPAKRATRASVLLGSKSTSKPVPVVAGARSTVKPASGKQA